jgi:imidazolonepropionase-like amidohydrolase
VRRHAGPGTANHGHHGCTLIDGTARQPLRDAVIVIDGSRITQVGARGAVSVPPGATVIDGQGKFVIPGLADMHHHMISGAMDGVRSLQASLRRVLALGITTLFNPSISLKDFVAMKALSSSDAAPFAHFFGTGPMIATNGNFLGALEGGLMPGTPQEAQAAVQQLKAAGVDAVKVERDDASWSIKRKAPLMPLDVLGAAVKEAHQQQLKVFAHAPMLRAAKEALRAGVDGLMHGIIDQPVDQEFLGLMKKNGASYVSTMGLYHDVADVSAWSTRQGASWDRVGFVPQRLYAPLASRAGAAKFEEQFDNKASVKANLPVQRANLKRVFDAGVPVVLGTDTGFPGMFIGVSTQIELELLVDAGLTPADALRTATINAARMIGQEKNLGTLEAGKAADLVILDADPLADIRNVTHVFRTLKGGVAYEPVDSAVVIRRGVPPGLGR